MPSTSYSLVLNNTHITNLGTGNNKLRYMFPSSVSFKDSTIAITQLSMYYSWQNITASYNNNVFAIYFPSGNKLVVSIKYEITIPDGNYEISDLNALLQAFFVSKGLYLIDDKGNNVFYVRASIITNLYKVAFVCDPVPSALPVGWKAPSNIGFVYPIGPCTPQVEIYTTNNFQKIVGIAPGIYPPLIQSTTYTLLSTTSPQISPVQCLLFQCNLTNNPYATTAGTIYATTSNDALYGSMIPCTITNPMFSSISNGSYPYIEIRIIDQDFKDVILLDSDIVLMLQIQVTV